MKWQIIFAAIIFATPVPAQHFTTANEVRPILEASRSNWVAIREYEGKDALYFTRLLAWRCGLTAIYFSINNGAETLWDGEPCYASAMQPNAIKDMVFSPFLTFDLHSIKNVQIRLVYKDGGQDNASFERKIIALP